MATLEEIKRQADEKIGSKVKVPIFSKEKGVTVEELEVKENKIHSDFNMVLTYFKDTSICVNALLTIFEKSFEIIKEE